LAGAALLVLACTSESVVGVTVGSVSVSPASTTLLVGEARSLSAEVRDERGALIPGTGVSWSSTDASVVSVTPGGIAEGLAQGDAQVRATVDGVTGSATVTVEPGPAIVATPATVAIFALADSDPPDAVEVEITNGGSGALTGLAAAVEYGAGQSGGWLSVSLASSSAPATLVLTATSSSLPMGDYDAVVRITSPTASNSPVDLPVRLSLTDDRPLLRLVPAAVGFAAVRGGAAPPPQEVEIQNAGGGHATGLAASISYQGTGGWLAANLADDAPPTVVVLTASLGTLAADTYRATVEVTSPDALNSPVQMAVTFVVGAEPAADLAVVKSGPGNVVKGDTAEFVLTVTNGGPGRASGVLLVDSLPGGFTVHAASPGSTVAGNTVTWDLGDLADGGMRADTVRAIATTEGVWDNVARVRSASPDTVPGNDRDVLTVAVRPQDANLSVSKSGPTTAGIGDTIEYVVTTANAGPGPAASLVVIDSLPAGLSFLSASGDGVRNGSVVTWSAGTLGAGNVRVDRITVRVDGTGSFTNVARARSSSPDPLAANNRATLTTSVLRVADISVVKSGPDSVELGDTIVYVLKATNAGPDTATAVVPADSLPAGVTFVSASGGGAASASVVTWPGSSLAPGAVRTDTVRARADSITTLVNVARVSSSTADPDSADRRATWSTHVRASDISVHKAAPDTVEHGDTVVYVLTLSNGGPDDAPGVQMRDTLPVHVRYVASTGTPLVTGNVLIWAKGLVPAGTSLVDTVWTVAETAGSAVNVARVGGGLADPERSDRRSITTTVILDANLSLAMTAPSSAVLGDTIVYTITLTNSGSGQAKKITVVDSLPPGVTFLSSTGSPTVGAGTLTWSRGALPAGVSNVDTVEVLATLAGEQTNVARASSESPPADLRAEATTTVPAGFGADLSVTKSGPATAGLGDTLTYVLELNNAGPDAALSVTLRDSLPAGTSFLDASPGATVLGSTVSWFRLLLAASSTVTETVRVVVTSGGTKTNVARVSSLTADPDTEDRRATAVTTITSADLSVTKAAPEAVALGDTIEYVIGVSNAGPYAAESVILVDSLPAGVTFVSATGGGTSSGTVVTWSKGSLASGAVSTDTLKVVSATDGVKTNVVRVTSQTSDPDPHTRRATAVTTVTTPDPVSSSPQPFGTPIAFQPRFTVRLGLERGDAW
jgi:uncharacterized repeat protein (TIGR01451 family)